MHAFHVATICYTCIFCYTNDINTEYILYEIYLSNTLALNFSLNLELEKALFQQSMLFVISSNRACL